MRARASCVRAGQRDRGGDAAERGYDDEAIAFEEGFHGTADHGFCPQITQITQMECRGGAARHIGPGSTLYSICVICVICGQKHLRASSRI